MPVVKPLPTAPSMRGPRALDHWTRAGEAPWVQAQPVCPVVIHHRPVFQIAAEKGKAITEIGGQGKGRGH